MFQYTVIDIGKLIFIIFFSLFSINEKLKRFRHTAKKIIIASFVRKKSDLLLIFNQRFFFVSREKLLFSEFGENAQIIVT